MVEEEEGCVKLGENGGNGGNGNREKNAYDDVGSSGDVIGFRGFWRVFETLGGVFAGWPVTTMMTMMPISCNHDS